MKQKAASYDWVVPNVQLLRSDLREIARIWLGEDDRYSLEVETDSHTFTDVEELIGFKDPVKSIKLTREKKGSYRYERVTITGRAVDFDIDNATDADIGVGTRIKTLVMKRRGLFVFGPAFRKWLLFLMFGSGAVSSVFKTELAGHPRASWALATVSLLSLAGYTASTFYSVWPNRFITFRAPAEEQKPINWRGVAWQLTLLGIGLAVGYVLKK